MSAPNKYTVHARLALLENAVTELRKENADLRVHLAGALQTAVNDAKHSFRDGRDGVDGKDGAPGRQGPKGDKGERGDCTVYGDAELRLAVGEARQKLIEQRAKFLAAIAQAEYDARGDSSVHRIIRGRIEQLKKDAGL
jgi:hypothetical protein